MYPWTVTRCYPSQCPNHLVVSCLDMHARHTYIRIKTHLRKYKSCQALQSGIIRYKNLTPFLLLLLRFLKVCKRRQDKKPSQKKECEALDLIEHVCLSANCTYISLHCIYGRSAIQSLIFCVFFCLCLVVYAYGACSRPVICAEK